MKKKSNIKKPVYALASMTLAASLLLPGAALAEENTDASGSFNLNSNTYLSNTGWSGNTGSMTSTNQAMTNGQSIFYDNANSFGYTWAYPADATGVQSSPAVSYGWHWTNGYEGAGNMPVDVFRDNARSSSSSRSTQMKNIDTSVAYSTADATGDYATGYTMYIHSTQQAGMETTPKAIIKVITSTSTNPAATDETGMMNTSEAANRAETSTGNDMFAGNTAAASGNMMQADSNAGAWGQWLDTISLGGSTWNVYRSTSNSDNTVTVGNMNDTVTFTYVRTANTNAISLNLTDFVKNLLDRNELMITGDYISGVTFGTDVMSGSGKLTVTDWNINVQ
ncbi:GH12 family glycosyl hydrolase domain-containing protein [Paenibacillus sp. SGZ-1009]|uniref:GH12 family glycosyl hydrolase domain-containing protein n=1 Tax=Paenibacillus campi TaxID=3106031 RepID=UPI002AFE0C72|nr:hypothetical protein [Paenibacillus sp. SGZ-1009]